MDDEVGVEAHRSDSVNVVKDLNETWQRQPGGLRGQTPLIVLARIERHCNTGPC